MEQTIVALEEESILALGTGCFVLMDVVSFTVRTGAVSHSGKWIFPISHSIHVTGSIGMGTMDVHDIGIIV